ncbi:MAG TPA: hypothetical protein VMD30_12195 [Tepidisphaeraceae bacterium]|nr:hypothetical protein [Tepidisphaeraceae bacterium]
MTKSFPLDYARSARGWPKRLRRILIGVFVAGVGIAGWRWGPYLWQQAHILYWQRECLSFSASPQTVVYEEDPALAASLLRQPDYFPYVLRRELDYPKPGPIVRAAAFVPACWRTLNPMYNVSASLIAARVTPAAIIFLHERISAAGHHRIVCIDYYPETVSFQPAFVVHYDYDATVLVPATWRQAATPVGLTGSIDLDVLSGYPRRPPLIRVYAGQIDPNDAAHFTIRYQMWGEADTLDGRLLDDDVVTLTPRHLPAWPRN